MSIEITQHELKLIRSVAASFGPWADVLDPGDLVGELAEWMLTHADQVLQLRARGGGMWTALRRVAIRAIRKERAARYGYSVDDQFEYPPGLLQELLPQALGDWSERDTDPTQIRSGADPAYGGERLAMLADTAIGLTMVSHGMQVRLRQAAEEGYDYEQLGLLWNITPEAAKARVVRGFQALSRAMSELRGPREYTGTRRVVSNGKAQAAIGRGDPEPTPGTHSLFAPGGVLS